MDNTNFETFKQELSRLKKTAPEDGEAKYREYNVIKNVGWFKKKRTIVKEQGELICIGDYITLGEFCRILSEFLEGFSIECNEVRESIFNYLKCDNIFIELVENNLILKFVFEDLQKSVKISLDSGFPKILEDNDEILVNGDIRKVIINFVCHINFYIEYLSCYSKEIKISDITSLQIENVDIANFGKHAPTLNVKFGNLGTWILSFISYVGYLASYDIITYSKNIETKLFLEYNARKIKDEIFIPIEQVKDIMYVASKYKEFFLLGRDENE